MVKMSQYKRHWKCSGWEAGSAACACGDSTAALFVLEISREAVKGFFIAHPWQIVLGSHPTECLYCSICISLARSCNPQRESISCTRCPFTSVIFTFSPIPYLFLLVSPILCSFFSLYFLKARIFKILPSLYLFIYFCLSFPSLFPPPFAPRGSLVMPACFIASCSISKPKARLFFPVPSCTIWCRFHLWPPSSPTSFPVSCVYTLHLPDDSIVSFQSPCLSFSTSFFFLIFISYPFSLFAPPPPSVIPSSSSPSVSVYWVLSSAHSLVYKWISSPKKHITISRRLYLTSNSKFIAVIFADYYWRGDTTLQTYSICACFTAFCCITMFLISTHSYPK